MPSTTESTKRRGGVASTLALVVAAVLIAALVVFVLQNTLHTTINFLGWNFDLAQSVSLLGAALIGSVITLALTAALRVRRAVR